jgi:hypothetical protein
MAVITRPGQHRCDKQPAALDERRHRPLDGRQSLAIGPQGLAFCLLGSLPLEDPIDRQLRDRAPADVDPPDPATDAVGEAKVRLS